MTQKQLAKRLDISMVTIRSWERKETSPNVHMILQLNDLLGIPLDDLVEDYQKEKEA